MSLNFLSHGNMSDNYAQNGKQAHALCNFSLLFWCDYILRSHYSSNFFIPSVYNFEHYTLYSSCLMLLSGVINYMAQTLRSAALKYAEATVIAPFSYFQVLFLFITDLVLFSYSFNLTEIWGGVIITLCLLGPELYSLYVHLNHSFITNKN